MRNVWIEKGAKELEKLRRRVKEGEIKDVEKIFNLMGIKLPRSIKSVR